MATHESMIDLFKAAAANTLAKTDVQILRVANDLFRDAAVTAGESTFRETDVLTRQSIAQKQLDEFARKGITAIVYSDGRHQPVESYAEMAGRTMSAHASVQADLNRYQEYGWDLVLVSSHARACELCIPTEGRVYSQSGQSAQYPPLADAIAQGLFHPNCAHNLMPWQEGIPIPEKRYDPAEQALIDEHGEARGQELMYEVQQKQRYNERKIREWKAREATSIDAGAQATAKKKVRGWQAAQRAHLKNNPFLQRDSAREQIGKAI